MLATLDHIEKVAPEVFTFWFKPPAFFRYAAGEFTELRLPHRHPDSRGDTRWFSLSSSPTEKLLGITTRLSPNKSSSYKTAMKALISGSQVQIAEPMGDFVLPKDTSIPLVFIAAGLGITPVRSIVRYLNDHDEHRNVHIFRIISGQGDDFFAKDFSRPQLHYNIVNTSQSDVHVSNFVATIKKDTLVYLAGPGRFVGRLLKELQQSGIASSRIITDLFPGYDN